MIGLVGCGPAPTPSNVSSANGDLSRLDFRDVVSRAKDKVFPAVVFIKCLRQSHESGEKVTEEVSGSGVIISSSGELVTNWHVVDKAVEIRCLLYDGRAFDAELVGSDKDTDLAMLRLKLPAAELVPFAAMGDSSRLKEGDFVMAMGAPWGLSRSVSIGIISCTKRFLQDHSEYSLWLQTDASISPGNSGGPLVNTNGEVIGVNTLGSFIGGDMGFAVPSETIDQVVPQLRQYGKVNWSWTGLQLQPLKDFDKNMYFEGTEGVIVSETDPQSPARKAGIQPRDRIVKIGDHPVSCMRGEDLPLVRRTLGQLAKNAPSKIELLRGSEALSVVLTPVEKGKVEGDELDCPRWDMTVKTINQFEDPDLYFYRNTGVFIFGTKYPGNAASAGLHGKDIILKVDNKEVNSLEDLKAIHKAAIDNVATSHRVVFSILRSGLMRQIVMDFSRDYSKE